MSMHEIEDFAELAVKLVFLSDTLNSEKITLIHNIYSFHDNWDTSFTKLRVFRELVECGYFCTFELREHPAYQARKRYFDRLAEKDFSYVSAELGETGGECYWVGRINYNQRYVTIGKLCCEAGSRLWQTLNPDKRQPAEMSTEQMLIAVADLAVTEKNYPVLASLYYVYMLILSATMEEPDPAFIENLLERVYSDDTMKLFHNTYSSTLGEPAELEKISQYAFAWLSHYTKWLKRATTKTPSNEDLEKYKTALSRGNPEHVYELYELLVSANMGHLVNPPEADLLDNINEKTHKRLMEYDGNEIESQRLRNFIALYKEYQNHKYDVEYLGTKGIDFINSKNYRIAEFFITKGLELAPGNPVLRLYDAYVSVICHRITKLRPAMEDLEKLLDELPDHEAFIFYLKGMGYYHLSEPARGRQDMQTAAELDSQYEEYYQYYYVNNEK